MSQTVNIILEYIFNEKQINITLTKCSIKKLILDCYNKTVFSFNNELYKQTDGVSMGSSLSPMLANIILTEFEHIVTDLTHCRTTKLYKQYVDNTLVLLKPYNIPKVLLKFDEFDPNLKFTEDTFPDGIIHFLDIKISADSTDVYCKETHTGQYTYYSSLVNLSHHAFKICSMKLFNDQITKIKTFMSWNRYPNNVSKFLIKMVPALKT